METSTGVDLTVVAGERWWQRRLCFAELLEVSRWCAQVADGAVDVGPHDIVRLAEVIADLPPGWRRWVTAELAGVDVPRRGFDLETGWTVVRRTPWPGDGEDLWQQVAAAVVLVGGGKEEVTRIIRVADRFYVDGIELGGRSAAKAAAAALLWLVDR